MRISIFIISLLLCGCSSFGRQVGSLGDKKLYADPDHEIGVATLSQRPLSIGADSILVHDCQHIFGYDPDIRVATRNKNYPNPFSPPPYIQIINLIPDTLTIILLEDQDTPKATIYHGFIERGLIDITIMLNPKFSKRIYLVDLVVGDETKRTKYIDLK